MFTAIRERLEDEDGFTLIELLVVVIIIGILAAIAIPTFLSQRQKGYDSAAKSDLRNAAIAQEAHFTETGAYASATTALTEYKASDLVTLTVASGSASGYCMTSKHQSSPTTFKLDTVTNKIVAGTCTSS